MEAPHAWFDLCGYFHQDFLIVYGTVQNAVEAFKEATPSRDVQQLSDFLSKLISSQMNEMQLEREWQQCGAQVHIRYTTMRDFFIEIQSLLNAAASK